LIKRIGFLFLFHSRCPSSAGNATLMVTAFRFALKLGGRVGFVMSGLFPKKSDQLLAAFADKLTSGLPIIQA